jgi:hypothetical protein
LPCFQIIVFNSQLLNITCCVFFFFQDFQFFFLTIFLVFFIQEHFFVVFILLPEFFFLSYMVSILADRCQQIFECTIFLLTHRLVNLSFLLLVLERVKLRLNSLNLLSELLSTLLLLFHIILETFKIVVGIFTLLFFSLDFFLKRNFILFQMINCLILLIYGFD